MAPANSNDRVGDLTTSGLLYEGSDFSEWKARITALTQSKEASGYRKEYKVSCATLVRHNVSDTLSSRIPEPVKRRNGDLQSLLSTLERFATSFRLKELPKELRLIIYELCIIVRDVSVAMHDVHSSSGHTYHHDLEPSPLMHVSQELRAEISPVFWATKRVSFYHEDYPPVSGGIPEGVIKWLANIGKVQATHLRSLTVYIDCFSDYGEVNTDLYYSCILNFSPGKGLTVKLDYDSEEVRYRHDDEHLVEEGRIRSSVKMIEETRKLLGLRGESLIMALTTISELWNYAELKRGGI